MERSSEISNNRINQTQRIQSLEKQVNENKEIVKSSDCEEPVNIQISTSTEETIYIERIDGIVEEVYEACDNNSLTKELLDKLIDILENVEKEEKEEKEDVNKIEDLAPLNGTPEIEEPKDRNYEELKKKRKKLVRNYIQSLIDRLKIIYVQCKNTGGCQKEFMEKLRKTLIYLENYGE